MIRCPIADAVDDLSGYSVRIALRLHERGRNSADEHGFGHSALAELRNISGHFSTACGVTDVDGIPEVQFRYDSGCIRGVGVHVMSFVRLGRAAVPTAVVGDDTISVMEEKHHLSVPVIRGEGPAMM